MAIATFVIKKFFARPAVDTRLLALIVKPVSWYMSTEFQRKRNAVVLYHGPVCKLGVSAESSTKYQHVAS